MAKAMDADFWLERWSRGEIGFHLADTNPVLSKHFPSLGLAPDVTVFVPLCGKSLDMHWLRSRGHPVIGVELSATAVDAFFEEAGLVPRTSPQRAFTRYDVNGYTILCGDALELTEEDLAGVRAVYDRAALVALPPEMRARYARTLVRCLPQRVDMLCVCFEYDQSRAEGPPFAVLEPELRRLYEPDFSVRLLERSTADRVPPRFAEKGLREFHEAVYALGREAAPSAVPGIRRRPTDAA